MKKKRIIASAVAIGLVFAMSLQVVFSKTGPFTLNFSSSGSAGHPDIHLSNGSDILCLLNGGSAHSGYQYYQDDNEVDYFSGTMEQKRLFWAYVLSGRQGELGTNERILAMYPDRRISNNEAKAVAWAHGAAGKSANVDYLAEHGFMALQNTPAGCKDANEIFKLISAYDTPEKAMGIMKIQKGPGEIDGQKLYDMMGLASMQAYHDYVKMEIVQAAGEMEIVWDDYNGWMWKQTGTIVAGASKTTPTIVKVTYDPAYFQVIKATGKLRYYTCAVSSSQPMYQAGGDVEVSDCYFYITTGQGYNAPPTTTIETDETGGGDMGEVTAPEVKVYQHRETFLATYNAELKKLDYETGNPLKDSIWEVDEKFDKSQLSEDESENGIVEKYMREEPNTWEDWLVCTNDLTTDEEGHISHTDQRYYDFQQTYCNGHPLPPSDEDGEDGGDEGDDSAMEAWQEMVDECEAKAEASGGHMHHWLCNSEEEPSEEESFEKSGCKEARDATYENFINLKYSYTFREVKARDGYTLHFINGHVDDVPLEIMTTAASEAEKEAEWTECDNSDIVISGYRQNYIGEDASEMGSEDDEELESYTIDVIEEEPKTTLQSLMSYLGFETATKETRYTITVIPRNSDEDFPKEETDTETVDDEDVSDYEVSFDDDDVSDEMMIATDSNAMRVSKIAKAMVGDTEFIHENENEVSYYGVRATSEDDESEDEDPDDSGDSDDDSDEEKWDTGEDGGKFLDEGAIIDEQPKVEEGPHDKTFHIWIVYDHRTEGEIHFNKRDMDLKAKEDENYSAFANANGDGSLEGAVYGLFAADPIYHPDTQRTGEEDEKGSGLIFDANDLVAVATTDRNGDGSFMVITEKPHSTYDYNTGKIVNSGKEYPKNLYDADTYRKEYEEEELGRVYENNLSNNGDYWIGRPLILGNYYIKELSRSEGYELSITGKEMAYTNRPNTSEGSDPKGIAWIKEQLHYANTLTGENEDYSSDNILTLTTASKGTTEGYNVVLDGLPESVTIKQVTHAQVSNKVTVPKGGEWVDATEEPLYKTADGGYQAKVDQNGNKIPDPNAKTVPAAYSAYAVELKKVMNPSATLSVSNTSKYNAMFSDSNTNFRYVKAETESMLRQMNMETPKGSGYSTETVPVYDEKTGNVYGRPEVTLTIQNVSRNKDVIDGIIEYYRSHPEYSYGGVQSIGLNGNVATVTLVICTSPNKEFVYEKDASGNIIAVYLYKLNAEYGRYVMRKYNADNFDVTTNNKMPMISVVPNFTVSKTGEVTDLTTIQDKYLYYAAGEVMYDYWYVKNGEWVGHEPIPRKVYKANYVEEVVTEDVEQPVEIKVVSQDEVVDPINETYALYDGITGQFTVHVGPSKETTDEVVETEFVIELENGTTAIGSDDIERMGGQYNVWSYSEGDDLPDSEHLIVLDGAGASIYVSNIFDEETSYVENVNLTYNGQLEPMVDAGTKLNAIRVLERPIRQKVKIVKDIQTIPNSEEYLHDTYSEVHTENLSKNSRGSWYEKSPDWLVSLLGGKINYESASKIPEFRFKVYLKSNLERLYRDGDGNITWLDRNGNALVPEYKDTNGDGNYETFVWINGNTTIDFPEKSVVTDENSIESANVQKIYTKVAHNQDSTTIGDISNNVWSEYNDPQSGVTNEVGELRGYTTSQDGENGEAVKTNASLYSYDDKNINVAESDKINQNANTGYTRLLESTVSTIEDGAGKTRQVETYNYEKFFDAMAAANNDKWDNDMWASKKNYPGQHWFETFQERYQMDDTDPDRTLANVDGADADNTAGGDKDTSFKPFQWIREHLFGTTQDAKDDYPATHDNDNLENKINTSDIAHRNAEASDEVRQFAIKWYLDDEVAKLVKNNGYDEDVAKAGSESYQEEVYDQALKQALIKSYNYLKPFYDNDLDTIYSVEWDSAENGGSDGDVTTLSADILYEMNGTTQGESKSGYYYGVSVYLPYGTYVAVEQQPFREDLGDFDNKHYKTDKPKEIILPAVYEEDGNVGSPEVFNADYNYDSNDTPEQLAGKYMIRFNEEWADNHTDDLRNYVIRAHGYDGDYEVYKYGLDVDKLINTITYDDGEYTYDGYTITQDVNDPLKNYYNNPLVDTAHDGGNENSNYLADDKNKGVKTAYGKYYADNAIEKRYHFGSISENTGIANDVIYQHGSGKDDNNPSGFYFKDNVKTMTGNQTAYEGKYASMLVPWSVVEPADSAKYDITNYAGYADAKYRNTFYATKLRVEKVDSETGEQILHDDAIFSIYAASRYTSRDEIEKAGAPAGTEIGDVKFYMKDTMITGSKEFLMSMGAWNIEPVMRGRSVGLDELYSGIVAAGTPVCLEEEQIIMEDMLGNKTGQFKVYATLNDIKVVDEEDANGPADKGYVDQNTGYLVTPQPLGAGVYVLAETKAPAGYAKTRPIAIEIYSDSVSYYMNGLMDSKVESTIYQGNLMDK